MAAPAGTRCGILSNTIFISTFTGPSTNANNLS